MTRQTPDTGLTRRTLAKGLVAGTAASALAAPAIAQSAPTVNWRMTSSFPKSLDTIYQGGPTVAKLVSDMTDKKFNIQVFAAGEIVPGLQVLDAVQNGTVECGHTYSGYYIGKEPALIFDGSLPFGMTPRQHTAWLQFGGGRALVDKVYDKFNVVAIPAGNTGAQMLGWFRKEIKTVDDFKGLKMRIPGLAGKVYAALGVDVKLLPGGEIFPALERGVIDAAEFVGPFQDRRLGLQKAAKYYYTTGWHESATVSELLVNKAAFEGLPKDLQAVVENAAAACNVISEGWCQRNNAEAMDDLVKNQGVIARPLPADVVKRLREVTAQVLAEATAKDPLTKKVHDSYMAYMAKFAAWSRYSEGPYHAAILDSV